MTPDANSARQERWCAISLRCQRRHKRPSHICGPSSLAAWRGAARAACENTYLRV